MQLFAKQQNFAAPVRNWGFYFERSNQSARGGLALLRDQGGLETGREQLLLLQSFTGTLLLSVTPLWRLVDVWFEPRAPDMSAPGGSAAREGMYSQLIEDEGAQDELHRRPEVGVSGKKSSAQTLMFNLTNVVVFPLSLVVVSYVCV